MTDSAAHKPKAGEHSRWCAFWYNGPRGPYPCNCKPGVSEKPTAAQDEKCERCHGCGEVTCDSIHHCEDPEDGFLECPDCGGTGKRAAATPADVPEETGAYLMAHPPKFPTLEGGSEPLAEPRKSCIYPGCTDDAKAISAVCSTHRNTPHWEREEPPAEPRRGEELACHDCREFRALWAAKLHAAEERAEAMWLITAALRERREKLEKAARGLADKVDATSECDHSRRSCVDVGCVGAEVRRVRAALAPQDEKP
jgi:hypothetical protein